MRYRLSTVVTLIAIFTSVTVLTACSQPELTEREKKILATLSLGKLSAPVETSNKYLSDTQARALGNQLFHDVRLSSNQKFSCISCHKPDMYYTDGLATAADNGLGSGSVKRHTPTLLGSAWNTWQYWDGRRDSLWSQALTPMEAPAEMANNRVAVARLILTDESYRKQYEQIFGRLALSVNQLAIDASPMGDDKAKRAWYGLNRSMQQKINRVFANTGKAIAAYQATLAPPESRFDRFVERLINNQDSSDILTAQELAGARLFINDKKTQCLECHNGPLLTNGNFHSVGSATFSGDNLDFGRTFGVQAVMMDEFNCLGRYSDAADDGCKHLQFLNRTDIAHTQGAFKTPTLRNVANTPPYFHDGRYTTLSQVVEHYNNPPADNGQHDLREFKLTEKESRNLVAFLKTLNAVDSP